jgi:hypothetical protein
MKRAALTLIACLCTLNTAVAQRTLEVLEGVGEYLLSHIELPSDDTGSLTLKPCASCPTELHRVTPATKYVVGGSQLALADFAAAVGEIRADGNADQRTMVGIFVDRGSHTVTSVVVFAPAP